jgi:hypothetical protein
VWLVLLVLILLLWGGGLGFGYAFGGLIHLLLLLAFVCLVLELLGRRTPPL